MKESVNYDQLINVSTGKAISNMNCVYIEHFQQTEIYFAYSCSSSQLFATSGAVELRATSFNSRSRIMGRDYVAPESQDYPASKKARWFWLFERSEKKKEN